MTQQNNKENEIEKEIERLKLNIKVMQESGEQLNRQGVTR